MKKILSLLLAAVIILTTLLSLFSCENILPEIPSGSSTDTPNNGGNAQIIKPELKDHADRGSVNFDKIKYVRPDFDKIISNFDAVTAKIPDSSISFEEKIDMLVELDLQYSEILTMASYSSIKKNEDLTNSYWNDEYAYISENYPAFSKYVEQLFVAAATSPDAQRFEEEYFGEGLIEKYKDGGAMTDELVALTMRETELENEYSKISEANTTITYGGVTDTCEALLSKYELKYEGNATELNRITNEINALYQKARSERAIDIFIELIKVRKDIANERGYDSYVMHAYESIGHEYTEDKLLGFIDEISKNIVPVWATLEAYVFSTIDDATGKKLDRVSLINNLYSVYEEMDEGLADAYSYMLNYGLYDVNSASSKRFEGSFATYLYKFNAPYLFVTTNGTVHDYMSLSHEFGHFYDSLINNGQETSIDLSEVSSTALEYLTFLNIGERLGSSGRNIHLSLVREALTALVFQSFYALFEHNVYKLSEDEISEANVIDAMLRAADSIGLNREALVPDPDSGVYHPLDYVMIPHLFISPSYVESYCTSVAVSLELYFLEKSDTGKGVDVYLKLINREGSPLMFEDYIEEAGLISPFAAGFVRDLAYKLYYDILGDYRFEDNIGTSINKSFFPAA